MDTTTRTFFATVTATDETDALARVEKYLGKITGGGFATTGVTEVHSKRNAVYLVEIADLGGDRNDAWFWLTSYGISPDESLGSRWQRVKGVGC